MRPPDDYSDLEESYVLQHEAVIPVSPSLTQDVLGESYVLQHEAVSPSPSLTEDVLQHEVVSPDSPSPSLIQDVLQHEVVSPEDSPSPSLTQENEAIPDHYFEVNVIKGKTGAMKGKTRETVSLLIGNHIFRKKNTLKDGTIRFSCNGSLLV